MIKEAVDINLHSKKFDKDYLKCCGGIYSPEWFWAKALYVLRSDNDVANACTSWVEHCDWIPFLLTGGLDVRNLKRGICSAGHKALWTDEYNGLPEIDFFLSLDPAMKKLEHPLFTEIHNTDNLAGTLCSKWAVKLGLSTNVLIGIGSLDAHMGAVGGQIEPYYLSKVMGTSTCDMMIASIEDNIGQIHGICGQVNGSIVPGMIGFEAGQSAFGDVYAWFEELLTATTFDFIEKSKAILLLDAVNNNKALNLLPDSLQRVERKLNKGLESVRLDLEIALLEGKGETEVRKSLYLVEGEADRFKKGLEKTSKLFRS